MDADSVSEYPYNFSKCALNKVPPIMNILWKTHQLSMFIAILSFVAVVWLRAAYTTDTIVIVPYQNTAKYEHDINMKFIAVGKI